MRSQHVIRGVVAKAELPVIVFAPAFDALIAEQGAGRRTRDGHAHGLKPRAEVHRCGRPHAVIGGCGVSKPELAVSVCSPTHELPVV